MQYIFGRAQGREVQRRADELHAHGRGDLGHGRGLGLLHLALFRVVQGCSGLVVGSPFTCLLGLFMVV